MPRNAKLTLELHPKMARHLTTLVKTGLYGRTVEEAAERLIAQGLKEIAFSKKKFKSRR